MAVVLAWMPAQTMMLNVLVRVRAMAVSAASPLYPPVLEPDREVQQQSCDEQEISHTTQTQARGDDACDQERRPQGRDAAVQRLAEGDQKGFSRHAGLTLRYPELHLLGLSLLFRKPGTTEYASNSSQLQSETIEFH